MIATKLTERDPTQPLVEPHIQLVPQDKHGHAILPTVYREGADLHVS